MCLECKVHQNSSIVFLLRIAVTEQTFERVEFGSQCFELLLQLVEFRRQTVLDRCGAFGGIVETVAD